MDEWYSAVLAGATSLALAISSMFYDSFHSVRLAPVLVLLTLLHVYREPKVLFCREFALYSVFVLYMFLQLLWTPNVPLAINTLMPALNFVLILVLVGSLVAFHNTEAVLTGMLSGIVIASVVHTSIARFPFVWPAGFSYNSIAGVYLFGLVLVLLLAWFRRSVGVLLPIGLMLLLLIVATTSVKTNLGIVLGVAASGVFYFREFLHGMRRSALTLLIVGLFGAYIVFSSDVLSGKIQHGFDRVMLGVSILQAREDLPGYSGFALRMGWLSKGLQGWAENPVFGHGVEAFRSTYGMTSHATVVDLLYNSGLIGLFLFYAVFASIIIRLASVANGRYSPICAVIFGATICYLFITMSGTMHYHTFLAAFVGTSAALLRTINLSGKFTHDTASGVPA